MLAVMGLLVAAHRGGWPLPFRYDPTESNHGPWRHFYFARDLLPFVVLGAFAGAAGCAFAALRRWTWATALVAIVAALWAVWSFGFWFAMCD
jgi:hypothetical protein